MDAARSRSAIERAHDLLVVVLFLVGIGTPPTLALFGAEADVAGEQRKREEVPDFSLELDVLRQWPTRFASWYADAFPLRTKLVRQHNALEWFVWRTSPADNLVQGRTPDWLFYSSRDILDMWRGAIPFTREELEAWQRLVEQRAAWLEERGIGYVFAVAPVKPGIYPEHVPEAWRSIGPSRLDQFIAHMEAHSTVEVLDPRPALLAAKADDTGDDLLYYRLGTHWTWRGALVAAQQLALAIDRLCDAEVLPLELSEMHRAAAEDQGDSWARRLYLEHRLPQENWVLTKKGTTVQKRGSPAFRNYTHFERAEASEPRVMLFHDSMGTLPQRLLAESVGELDCYWQKPLDTAMVERHQPDVVVDLVVERMFVEHEPAEFPLRTQEWLRGEFERGTALLRISPATDDRHLVTADLEPFPQRGETNELRVTETGDGLLLEAPARGPRFGIVDVPVRHAAFVRFRLTFDRETMIEARYPVGRPLRFDREFAYRASFGPGRHDVYLPFHSVEEKPYLVADPDAPSTWTLHEVEIRVLPD